MKGNHRFGNVGKIAGAFALGATAASVAALLLAPASGKVIRRKLGMSFRSLKSSSVRQIKQAKKLLLKKADHLKEVATEKLGQTRKWLVQRAVNGNHAPGRVSGAASTSGSHKNAIRRRVLQRT